MTEHISHGGHTALADLAITLASPRDRFRELM